MSRPDTSRIVRWKCGSDTGSERFCTSTVSDAFSGKACAYALSARPDSPLPAFESEIVFIPDALPRASEISTNASHPQMAVLRWFADQRPARAAMFIGVLLWLVRVMTRESPHGTHPRLRDPDAAGAVIRTASR